MLVHDMCKVLVLAHGSVNDAGENAVFGKFRTRLPVFRDGRILRPGATTFFWQYFVFFNDKVKQLWIANKGDHELLR